MLTVIPALYLTGLLLAGLGVTMLLPALVDLRIGNPDWKIFAASAAVTWLIGALMAVATRRSGTLRLDVRQAFLMVTTAWVAVAGFSALPFLGLGIGYSDAFFEAISGMTTTGSTVLVGIETLAPGVLFWRALLQWFGGVGIIVTAIIILPYLRVGGMQLFRAESSEKTEKIVPRAVHLVSLIVATYVVLTAACAVAYGLGGMSAFDAVCHAMTTLATGGYANYDASFAHFAQPAIHWIAIVFMLAGALPFTAYIVAARGQPERLWRNPQIRALLMFVFLVSALMALWLHATQDIGAADALRLAFFNVVSVVTTTGFANDDFNAWGPLAVGVFFMLMFVGGCTGSTSGSIKIYRHQVISRIVRGQLQRLARPSRVVVMRYDGRRLPDDVPSSVLAFITVYLGTIGAFTVALAAMGLDFLTALTAATTAISNVGPGLGEIIGPAGNFAAIPDAAKWMLSAAMLMGRLELFAVLVLFDPDFWRR